MYWFISTDEHMGGGGGGQHTVYVIWNDVRMMTMLTSSFFKWKCKVNLTVVLTTEIIDG